MKIRSKLINVISATTLNLTVLSEGRAVVSEIHLAPQGGAPNLVALEKKTNISSLLDGITVCPGSWNSHVDLNLLPSGVDVSSSLARCTFGACNEDIVYMNLYEQWGDDWVAQAIGVPIGKGKAFPTLTPNSKYRLDILGLSTGTPDGSTNRSETAVAAGSEPEDWAMMIVGIGLVGYQVRRKQRALNRQAMLA